jgi:hypothetical protein
MGNFIVKQGLPPANLGQNLYLCKRNVRRYFVRKVNMRSATVVLIVPQMQLEVHGRAETPHDLNRREYQPERFKERSTFGGGLWRECSMV